MLGLLIGLSWRRALAWLRSNGIYNVWGPEDQ